MIVRPCASARTSVGRAWTGTGTRPGLIRLEREQPKGLAGPYVIEISWALKAGWKGE